MADLAERVVELASRLIAIDSVNPSLEPTGAGEAEVAAHVADRLDAAGFDVRLVVGADPRRPSVVATRSGSRAGRSIVLNGHLDTVGIAGMPDALVPRIEGSRMLGRGASDMKGGVAGLVVAAEELARADVAGRLAVALVADEEDASAGATAVLGELADRPDVCLIAEPTWLDLASAHRGYEVVRVTASGRAAHSSQPEEGVDVVPVVAGLLGGILVHDGELRRHDDPELSRGSLMATVVRAGTAPFMVPASAEVIVERRTLPGEDVRAGSAEVRALVEDLDRPPGLTVAVEPLIARAPWRLAASGPSADLAAVLSASLEARGVTPARRGFPYWMESAMWEEAGIPTVVCGPAGGGLHAVDEWVDLDQLRLYPTVVVEAVTRFAGG